MEKEKTRDTLQLVFTRDIHILKRLKLFVKSSVYNMSSFTKHAILEKLERETNNE